MAAKAFDSSGAAAMQQPVRLSAGGEGAKGSSIAHSLIFITFEHGFQGHKVDATDSGIAPCTTKQQASPAAGISA